MKSEYDGEQSPRPDLPIRLNAEKFSEGSKENKNEAQKE